jgi:putative oxidoreductase
MSTSNPTKNAWRRLLSSQSWSIDLGLLILRLCCALMFLHGWGKFTEFSDGASEWPDPFHVGPVVSKGLTVFAELFCTLLVVLGLFTRLALIPLIICMIVIIFVMHAGEPFGEKELGVHYLLAYLTLLFTGPGKYSVDGVMRNG